MSFFRTLLVLLFALALTCSAALAVGPKTFAVAPFAVHGPEKYAYLSQGIQSMLTSRLTWKGHLQAIDSAQIKKVADGPVAGAQAPSVRSALDVDYLVYGSTTILGDDASLDLTVLSADGQAFAAQESMPLSAMIPTLETVSQRINQQLFERKTEMPVANVQQPKAPAAPVNPGFVQAQGQSGGPDALNSNFKVEAAVDSEDQWRTRTMPFRADLFAVGDMDGGGDNEVVFVADHTMHVCKLIDGDLRQLGEYDLPRKGKILHLSLANVTGDRRMEAAISTWDGKRLASYIIGFGDGKFEMLDKGLRFHVRAMELPPSNQTVLVGQPEGPMDLFDEGNIRMVHNVGGSLQLGPPLRVPDEVNIYGFSPLKTKDGEKFIHITDSEIIKTYTADGNLQAATEEKYNGSAIGVEIDDTTLPGMGKPRANQEDFFSIFMPIEPVVVDLDRDGFQELLVNRNISVSSEFFQNYRSFSQGEIHCLAWDGINLNLLWKTRRIRGTVFGYTVADIDNDGQDELAVAVNTYAGVLGLKSSRSTVTVYELNLDKPVQ